MLWKNVCASGYIFFCFFVSRVLTLPWINIDSPHTISNMVLYENKIKQYNLLSVASVAQEQADPGEDGHINVCVDVCTSITQKVMVVGMKKLACAYERYTVHT